MKRVPSQPYRDDDGASELTCWQIDGRHVELRQELDELRRRAGGLELWIAALVTLCWFPTTYSLLDRLLTELPSIAAVVAVRVASCAVRAAATGGVAHPSTDSCDDLPKTDRLMVSVGANAPGHGTCAENDQRSHRPKERASDCRGPELHGEKRLSGPTERYSNFIARLAHGQPAPSQPLGK